MFSFGRDSAVASGIHPFAADRRPVPVSVPPMRGFRWRRHRRVVELAACLLPSLSLGVVVVGQPFERRDRVAGGLVGDLACGTRRPGGRAPGTPGVVVTVSGGLQLVRVEVDVLAEISPCRGLEIV